MARRPKSRFLVLGLLSEGPKSGYDIKTEVEEVINHFWKESFGSIYPVLEQLEGEELIAPAPGPEDGRGRRAYVLTRKGRTALARWLAEPLEPDIVRNELLLKLYVGGDASADVLIRQVDTYRERNEAFLTLLSNAEREIVQAQKTEVAVSDRRLTYRLLTVRLGKRVASARIKWANDALLALDEMRAIESV